MSRKASAPEAESTDEPGAAPETESTPEAQTGAGEDQPETPVEDPDVAELAAARAALEAEEKAASGDEATPPDADSGAAEPKAPAPAADADEGTADADDEASAGDKPAPQTDTIPKPRFDEVNTERNALREENAYLKGRLEAMAANSGRPADTGTPDDQAQQQGPTPDERIAQARERRAEAAAQYDAGTITTVDFERIRDETDDEIYAARLEQQKAATPAPQQPQAPTQPQVALSDEMLLNQHDTALEADHPFLAVLSKEETEHLADIAMQEGAARGQPYGPGMRDTYRLHTAIAELSDTFGPRWHPGTTPQAKTPDPRQQTGQPSAQTQQQGDLSQKQRQTLAKLRMAADAPPDSASMGSAGETEELSDERIASMSDDELENLPPSVRNRLKT